MTEKREELNCSEECNSNGCLQMAEDNFNAAPEAFLTCPCAYLGYGCIHCCAVYKRGDKPLTASDISLDKKMREQDEICKDKHVEGCLCCVFCRSRFLVAW
ncbi:hypothetical protein DPMN_075655 [Dreissena polymorpha]|uniref:Uncharacterized protein n=1 Tax=Dreissena polymorpha TaxID=45954 RepID=A0A9D3YM48_DREPO|nr:hypothetical protein DPMN_075655 [Dreissena polymorpha]